MSSKITAYAWESGLIEFGQQLPDGALPIITGENEKVRELIDLWARHSEPAISFLSLEHPKRLISRKGVMS